MLILIIRQDKFIKVQCPRQSCSSEANLLGYDNMRRDKIQIMAAILDICMSGANKTRVVYQSNLNFKTVNPYLDTLVGNGLLDVKHGPRILYETTEKGTDLLENLVNIEETLSK